MSVATTQALRQRLRDYHRIDEDRIVEELIAQARFTHSEQQGIRDRATPLVQTVRDRRLKTGGIDAFLTKARAETLSAKARQLKSAIVKKQAAAAA